MIFPAIFTSTFFSRQRLLPLIMMSTEGLFVQAVPYEFLVWTTYHLAAIFTVGLPLVLVIWALIRKEASMVRLLTIYWKVASLLAISMLLLTDQKPIGYLTAFTAPILMVISIWFWIDLNEELVDLPPWRPLPLTIRIWRWSLTLFGLLASSITYFSLSCIQNLNQIQCLALLDAPKGLHKIIEQIFAFLFGGNWSESVAAFVGYIALIAYIIGLTQWLLIRLPKQGRIAGEF